MFGKLAYLLFFSKNFYLFKNINTVTPKIVFFRCDIVMPTLLPILNGFAGNLRTSGKGVLTSQSSKYQLFH